MNRTPTRISSLVVIILLSLTSAFSQDEVIRSVVKSVKEKYAPDKRTALYAVEWTIKDSSVVLRGEVDNPEAHATTISSVLSATSLNVVDSIRVLPDPSLGAKLFGILIVSVGNVRVQPDNTTELYSQELLGTVIKLLKSASGNYYVQLPDKSLGWIAKSSVQSVTKEEVDAWALAPKVIVTGYFGIVREAADVTSLPVCDVVFGCMLKAGAKTGGWTAVSLADGRQGYVESALVEDYDSWKNTRRLTGENIAKTAKMFIGVPYLWGGTSAKGMDCSGFTKTVYRMNGMELNRDASQQVLMGTEVNVGSNFENSRTGDLLFFGRKATADKPERITHVGIYLENRKFIHSSGRVHIGSFDPNSNVFDKDNTKNFVRSRRLIAETSVPEVH